MRMRRLREVAHYRFNVRGVGVIAASAVTLCGVPICAQTIGAPTTVAQSEDKNLINPDRPGIADGSTVIGRGRVQIEAGLQQEFRRVDGGTEHTRFIPTLVRVGLSARWEVRFESNTFTQVDEPEPDDASSQTSRLAPVSFGVKFHLQDSGGVHRPSLGAILRVFPPSGTDGLRTTRAAGDLRLAADWDLTSRVSLNPTVGVGVYEDRESRRFAAGIVAVTLNYFNDAKTVNPFVDVGLLFPETSAAGSSFIYDAGLAYIVGRNVQVDVSAGAGPHGRTPPHIFVSVGISVRFH